MRKTIWISAVCGGLAACAPNLPMYSRADAIDYCQEQARQAAGPTGSVTIGANSSSGPFLGAQINLSDAYLRGLDPAVVYENCMNQLAANGQISEGS